MLRLRHIRAASIVGLVATVSVFATGASAHAATLTPIDPGAPATFGSPGPLHDPVLRSRGARARAVARAASVHAYRTADGQTVNVELSQSFADTPQNRATAQTFVDFLGTRVHGSELGKLSMFIGTQAEIADQCGGASNLACYVPEERRMYVPATDPDSGRGGYTREYVITHEYGHHIAAYRRNDPFPALDYGPKYWSSYEHVCVGVELGRYFPGNQGSHYADDPGESWADSYAHLHYPSVGWQFNASLRPNAGAFAAVRRDVLTPWSGPQVRMRRRLSSSRRVTTTGVTFALDGVLSLRLDSPRGANFDLQVVDGGSVVAQTHARGSRDSLVGTVCRPRATESLTVRVRRRSGAGQFSLRVAYPG